MTYQGIIERVRAATGADRDYVPHIHKDGARFHVLSWGGYYDAKGEFQGERYCSHPRCIVNKPANDRLAAQSQEPK